MTTQEGLTSMTQSFLTKDFTEDFTKDFTNDFTNDFTTMEATTGMIYLADLDKGCSEYYQNSSGFILPENEYEGIPENLMINVVAWIALIVVFTFLRRIGNYGRFGLIKNDEEKYASNYFKKTEIETKPASSRDLDELSEAEPNSDHNKTDSSDSGNSILERNQSTLTIVHEKGIHSEKYKDKHFFSWFIHMWTLKDEHIKEKSGKDAMYYLIFQRYLIVYLFIITILSLSILLPINILNNYTKGRGKFQRFTITNVDPSSPVLWVHLMLSWVFLVMGFAFVKVFSRKMKYSEGEYVSRTILITNFPIAHCNVDSVKRHFSEAYPTLNVTDIQFAYDIRELGSLTKKKDSMESGRIISQKIFDQTNQRPTMHPFHFGSVFELCCCCCTRFLADKNRKIVDSIEYYTKREKDLIVQIAEYKEKVLKNPLGILFVTFENQEMAGKFLKDYHLGFVGGFIRTQFNDKGRCLSCYICKNLAKESSVSNDLNADMWNVKYATSPSNIIWENVAKYGISWWLRVIIINIVLFIVMIFFTTPSILIDQLFSLGSLSDVTKEVEKIIPDVLREFLPSLILRLLAALLPVLVALTAVAELHWTRSSRNRSMMVKTYTLLLFMTLILPTLGLTSINLLFQWFNDDKNIKWRCIADNGAFFIKYVTTFGLIGTALDLLRLPDLFLYLLKMMWSRSAVERYDVRQKVALEFNYGVEYAWILSMFTITLSFSVVCPLITVVGLMYMVLKHLVDRYNLYFGYIPTKVDKRIHKTAVTITIGSFIILQFCILFFIAVRNKGTVTSSSMSTVQIMIITISCCLFVGRIFFGFFKRISPFHKHSGSSCQISHDIENGHNDELDTQESYSKLEPEESDINDTQIQQPLPGSSQIKKKRRNIFKKAHKIKRYEIFQSPFIPSLLHGNKSGDYENIGPEIRIKSISMNSSHLGESMDLANIVAENKANKESSKLEKNDTFATASQVDLILDSSLESNAPKSSRSTDDDSSPSSQEGPTSKNKKGQQVGLRNVAFLKEETNKSSES